MRIRPTPLNFGASAVPPSAQPSANGGHRASTGAEGAGDPKSQPADAVSKKVTHENILYENDPLSDILSRPLTDDDCNRRDKMEMLEQKVKVIKKKFKLTLHATSINHNQVEKLKKERQQKLDQLKAASKTSQRKAFATRTKSH